MFTVPMESIRRLEGSHLLNILLQLWQNEVAFNTYLDAGQ